MPDSIHRNLPKGPQSSVNEPLSADKKKHEEVTGTTLGRKIKFEPEQAALDEAERGNQTKDLVTQKKLIKEPEQKSSKNQSLPPEFIPKRHKVSLVHEPRLGEGNFGTVQQRLQAEDKATFFQRQGFHGKFYQDLKGSVGHLAVEKIAKKTKSKDNNLKGDVTIYDHFPPHRNIMKLISNKANFKKATFEYGGVDLSQFMKEKEIKATENKLQELKDQLKSTPEGATREEKILAISKVEEDLAKLENETKPSPSLVMGIILQSARGLSHLHQHGIMHRDIKPDNILIDAKGDVRLGDLGLAITVDSDSGLGGTPRYQPPEAVQWYVDSKGKNKYRVKAVWTQSRAGDMWALGAVALDLLNGKKIAVKSRENSLKAFQEAVTVNEEQAVGEGKPLSTEQQCMKELVFNIIPGLLNKEYEKRTSSQQLVNDQEQFIEQLIKVEYALPDYLK